MAKQKLNHKVLLVVKLKLERPIIFAIIIVLMFGIGAEILTVPVIKA